jgi:homoserine dehydrogenase
MNYKLAFIGFGTVGHGLAEILIEKKAFLKQQYGFDYSVVAISDMLKGSVYEEDGLELEKIMALVKESGKIDSYPQGVKGWDSIKTIKDTNADIIIEATYTDIKTGEPAITHIKTALSNKKHVVTTNKGPIALAYKELSNLAKENGVFLRFEGTVLSGTPSLNLGLEALAGINIKEAKGILNGTTNYILTEMEKGRTYDEVLKEAQRLGYAEAKPDADVEGWDALAKIVIIANVLMGADIKVGDVERKGITKLTLADIEEAKREKKRWKLIARAWHEGNKIKTKVTPEKISKDDFLAGVSGVTNALTFVTDDLGEVTIVGPGAGRRETGFSLLTDILNIHRIVGGQAK